MFCQRCGTAIADSGLACPSCSAPAAQTVHAATIADKVKATSKDALGAFRSFAVNPVAGLQPAYAALGDAKALRTGVAFGVVSVVCFLLGGYLMLPPFMREDLFRFLGFGGVMKCLLFAVVPFVCTVAGSAAVRKMLSSQGTLGGDCFTSGAALLPVSFCMLLAGILSLGNLEAIAALSVFAGCVCILMLFSGYTRISKLTERAGSIAVPSVVILGTWLAKIISTSVLTGSGSSGMNSGFPF